MDIEQLMTPQQFSLDNQDPHIPSLPSNLVQSCSYSQMPYFTPFLTPEQIIHQLLHTYDIIDMPISSIVGVAVEDYNLDQPSVKQFLKKIKKTKNGLKRARAKARVAGVIHKDCPENRDYGFEELSTEKEVVTVDKDIKKQKNRISAQISRDRKKNYVTNLETQNKELTQESEFLRLENERLRKQISQHYNRENQKKNKNGSKFMKLLVLLGVVFLFYILKDVFSSKTKKSSSCAAMFAEKPIEVDQEIQEISILAGSKHIVQEIVKEVQEMEQEKSTTSHHGYLKELTHKKISEISKKITTILAPDLIWSNLGLAKTMLGMI